MKNFILSLLGVVVIAIIIFGVLWYFKQEMQQEVVDVQSTEFAGYVLGLEDRSAVVKGNYVVVDRPEFLQPSMSKEVVITLNPEVKFIRLIRSLPSPEELSKLGTYQYGQFPTEEKEVSFEQFLLDLAQKDGQSLKITSTENIFDKEAFTPSTIEYHLTVFANTTTE